MKRATFAAALATALVAVFGVAPAAAQDVRGPACADIVGEQHNYRAATDANTYTLNFRLLTAAGKACPGITYTLYVIVDEGEEPLAFEQTGSNEFANLAIVDDPELVDGVLTADRDICVYATTSAGRHIFDVALLDGNCLPVTAGTTGGSSTFG